MKLQLGITGEKLSDLSRAIEEVLTHHWVYTLLLNTHCWSLYRLDIHCLLNVSVQVCNVHSLLFATILTLCYLRMSCCMWHVCARHRAALKCASGNNNPQKKSVFLELHIQADVHAHTHFSSSCCDSAESQPIKFFGGMGLWFWWKAGTILMKRDLKSKANIPWQRKFKVPAVGWAKDLSLIG